MFLPGRQQGLYFIEVNTSYDLPGEMLKDQFPACFAHPATEIT
jgi:hypothetical protein